MTQSDTLARAIDYLGTVEIEPGFYAFQRGAHNSAREGVSREWYVATTAGLKLFGDCVSIPEWVEDFGKRMPAWWSPDTRFAWRLTFQPLGKEGSPHKPGFHFERFFTTEGEAMRVLGDSPGGYIVERITADLETGQETPC